MPIIKIPGEQRQATPAAKKNTPTKENDAAVLIIEEPKPAISKKEINIAPKTTISEKPKLKLGSLAKIQEQIVSKNTGKSASKPITIETLQTAWKLFIEQLSKSNKHSEATNFQFAEVKVIDENNIEIITDSNIQQKFIDAERAALITHLQQYFNNNQLKYQITIIEKEVPVENGPKPLNSKEHFHLLAEQYPAIKDLREKLKLDLEF